MSRDSLVPETACLAATRTDPIRRSFPAVQRKVGFKVRRFW